jgi:DNA-binding MarR family transcriptional regulator
MNYLEPENYGIRIDEDELVEAAVRLLPLMAPALYGTVAHLAQAHHLTPAQMKVILQVGLHGQMTMGEIACSLSVSMPATSEVVDRLVEAGHLVRASDPADRRRVLIAPTPATMLISEAVNDLRRAQVRHALDQLSPEERPVFARVLEALLQGLTSIAGVDPVPCPADAAFTEAPPPRGTLAAAVAGPSPANGDRQRQRFEP